MLVVFELCKKLIEKGKIDGLVEKMDVYLACERLTAEEYSILYSMLNGAE